MRLLKYVFLPAIAALMVVMPFAESAIANDPVPQATPVIDEEPPPPDPTDAGNLDEESTPTGNDAPYLTKDDGGFQTAQSVEPTISFDHADSFYGLPDAGYLVSFNFDFTGYAFGVPDNDVMIRFSMHTNQTSGWFQTAVRLSNSGRINSENFTFGASFLARECLVGQGNLDVRLRLSAYSIATSETVYESPAHHVEIPCSAETTPVPPIAQSEMCGPGNDSIEIPDQPNGVNVEDSDWMNGERTVTFNPASYAFFPDGTKTTYTFEDDGSESSPCIIAGELNPPTIVELCGPNNDVITPADTQPTGVNPVPVISEWDENEAILTYTRTDGQALPEEFENVITVEDQNDPCIESFSVAVEDGAFLDRREGVPVNIDVTFTLADTHPYDTISIFHMQDATVYGDVSPWLVAVEPGIGGSTTVTIPLPTGWGVASAPRHCDFYGDRSIDIRVSVTGYTGEVRDRSSELNFGPETFPCTWIYDTEPEISITQVEICGPNNDTFEVSVEPDILDFDIREWQDGTTTIRPYNEIGKFFVWHEKYWNMEFTDAGLPCPTDAPAQPVQTAVCGPDNDQITIPPQPEDVTLENDSGWENGTRTITFAVDPAFITEGETEFTFTDEDIACPIPTITLTVQLTPSDGGSLEEASWQLYAPVAAQNVGTEPFAEGTVGNGNSIVVEELIAGDYRLVVNAAGYERIDTMITIAEGEETQLQELQVPALQPVETPTPEPTIVPTVEATPTSVPTDPTPVPTEQSSDVTGLPSTGSGSGGGFGILALAGLLAASMLVFIVRHRATS